MLQFVGSTTVLYSAIIQAFDKLGRLVQQLDNDNNGGYEEDIKACLKYEGNILTKLIPSFKVYDADRLDMFSLVRDEYRDNLKFATERLALAFRSFLRLFTTTVRPLVLFLDDLQWADRYSQELSKLLYRRNSRRVSFSFANV